MITPATVQMLHAVRTAIARPGRYFDLGVDGAVEIGSYTEPRHGPVFVSITETSAAGGGSPGLRLGQLRRSIAILGWGLAETDRPEQRITAALMLADDLRAALWGLVYPHQPLAEIPGLVSDLTLVSEEVVDYHDIAQGRGAWGVCAMGLQYTIDTTDGRM